MKRFSFPLARVLDYRRQAEDLERGRLEALVARHQRLIARAGEDARRSREVRSEPLTRTLVASVDLQRAWAYADLLERSRVEALAEAACIEQQVRAQRAVVLEARRARRLLEILREKKLARHARLEARDQESLAGELHLARLGREPAHLPSESKKTI